MKHCLILQLGLQIRRRFLSYISHVMSHWEIIEKGLQTCDILQPGDHYFHLFIYCFPI